MTGERGNGSRHAHTGWTASPAGAAEIRNAWILVLAVALLAFAALPWSTQPSSDAPFGVQGWVASATGHLFFLLPALTGVLLGCRAMVIDDARALLLAAAFVALAVCRAFAVLAFDTSGTVETARLGPWLTQAGNLAFAALAAIYGISQSPGSRLVSYRRQWLRLAIWCVVLAAVAVVAGRMAGHLPALLGDIVLPQRSHDASPIALSTLVLATTAMAMTGVWGAPHRRTRINLWLLAILAIEAMTIFFGLAWDERPSVGWFVNRLAAVGGNGAMLWIAAKETMSSMTESGFVRQSLESLVGSGGLVERERFEGELERAWRRDDDCVSVLLFEMEEPARYADLYGQPSFEDSMHCIGMLLTEHAQRAATVACRYDATTFALLLQGFDPGLARDFAMTIKAAVWTCGLPHASSRFGRVTVKLGVATNGRRGDAGAYSVIRAARESLERSKRLGP